MKSKEKARRRRHAHREAIPRLQAPAPNSGAEREIKLHVPDEEWQRLLARMTHPDTRTVHLHASYLDTPGRELSRAGIALRVRREGERWVQTLKAPGPSALERIEDEVVLGEAREDEPAPHADLDRHRLPAARHALRAALGLGADQPPPPLQAVFEVKVLRRVRLVEKGRSRIEISLDEGEIVAADRRMPVRELEMELLQGSTQDLLALARRWRERWNLWLGTASKAARGNRLASAEAYGPPVGAAPPRLPAKPDMGQFTRAVLHACLVQVLGNASEIAAGSPSDDHVHQLRVGLRRLRTALRELPMLADERKRHEPTLVEVFRRLGERRDRTHVLRAVQPLVEQAGGAPVRVPPEFGQGPDPRELVRGGAFQDALLALLSRAEQVEATSRKPLRATVRARLAKLHEQVTREGRQFTRLSEDHQHQVRKRLKRLRYLSEFAAPLFPTDAVGKYLAEIKPAQDALGQYNDEIMAQSLYEELAGSDPAASFGARLLRDRRTGQAKGCRKSLRKLDDAPAFFVKE